MSKILIYGDSITWGADVKRPGSQRDKKKRFGYRLSKQFPEHEIYVDGLPGRYLFEDNTYFSAYRDVDRVVNTYRPLDLIIVYLGTNDFFGGRTKKFEDFTIMINNFVEKFKEIVNLWDQTDVEKNCIIPQFVFVTPANLDGLGIPSWLYRNEKIITAYKNTNFEVIDLFSRLKLNSGEQHDGVHLDDQEDNIVYKTILDFLSKI